MLKTTVSTSDARFEKSEANDGFKPSKVFQKQTLLGLSIAVAMGVSYPQISVAEEEPQKRRGSAAALMEEVVVSARKKSEAEAIQDVPIAMNAFGGDQIEAMFADNVTDIGLRTPNVQLESQGTIPSVASYFIRGMGTQDSIPSTDPTVGTFVDGMYLGVPWGVVTDIHDLASIEVLRGPQGTLFGRNVTGGAVVMKSRLPTGEFGFRAKATVGNNERRDASISVENALTDNFAGKLSVLYKSNGELYDNKAPGARDMGENETIIVRPIFSWSVSDDVQVNLITEFGDQNIDSAAVKLLDDFQVPALGITSSLGDHEISNNFTPETPLEWWHAIVQVEWQLGNGTLKSITAYRDLEVEDVSIDVDASPLTLFHALDGDNSFLEQDQFSQEFVYAFAASDSIDITTGLYYFEQEFDYAETWLLFSSGLGGFLPLSFANGSVEHTTAGAFVQADVKITDDLTATIGGRYTYEEKEAKVVAHLNALFCPDPMNPGCDFDGEEDWNSFTPKLGLQYYLNDETQFYASWTRGFRSGGFNVRTTNPANSPGPYEEEEVEAFELGFKTTLLDGRLVVNGAWFYNEYEDLQRSVTDGAGAGASQVVLNAAGATISGAELDLTAAVTDNFVITAAIGYTNAVYDDFEIDLDVPPDGINDPEAENFELAHVPEWNYSLSGTYDLFLDSSVVTFRATYTWVDDRFNDDKNSFVLEDYELVDASITLATDDDQWKVSLFGKNLTDEEWASNGFALAASSYTYLTPPRSVGLEVSYQY